MAKAYRKIRAPFERAAIHVGMAILPRLPRCGVLALAQLGGRAGYLFDTRGRRIGLANLDVVFGDQKTAAEKKRILKASFVTMTRTLIDTFWFAHHSAQRLEKYVEMDPNSQVFFQDKAQICLTAHFGNWEIMGQMSGHKGLPVSSIATPIKNKTVNKYFIRAREATGQKIIPKQGALRKLLTVLRQGGKTAFLTDQNTSEKNGGIWVDFFGLPATVTAAPAMLASRTGAEILMEFSLPLPGGHYRFYSAKTFAPPENTEKESLRRMTEAITRTTEDEIRKHPECWLWMYKRWKNKKPGGESAEYPWYTNLITAASRKG
jgi:lauroyl/myristoyl acyltransferase